MKINHRDFLPAVQEVQEAPPSPLGRLIMWIIMTLLVCSVVWASMSEVDIVAVTRGKLAVSRLSRPVHTAVTADIAEVYVQEGERVKAGQPLIRLNAEQLEAQHKENVLNQYINQLHIARLAIMCQQYADNDVQVQLPEELLTQNPILSRPLQAQLNAEILADKQEKMVLHTKQLQLQAQLEEFQAQKILAEGKLPIYRKQYNALAALYKNKLTSEDSLLEVHKQLLEAEYSARSALTKLKEGQANYQQAVLALSSYIAEKVSQTERSRVELLNENALLVAQKERIEASLRQYVLTAPVDGRVDSLLFRDKGAAVEVPQEMLKIVPEGERLNAEVWISNQDVGFLHLGQVVTVKIDTYDFTRYGWIEGRLTYLSADAVEDKDQGLVYKGIIELLQDTLVIDGKERSLEPGMSVSAEIRTGKRTVLSYLLSPMLEALDDVGKQR